MQINKLCDTLKNKKPYFFYLILEANLPVTNEKKCSLNIFLELAIVWLPNQVSLQLLYIKLKESESESESRDFINQKSL